MAEDAQGRKFNRIPSYTRTVGKKRVKVRTHDRSNPVTSHGKKKSRR